MLITPDMDLSELVSRMYIKTTQTYSGPASLQEAADLRGLLVRDFPGMDTDDIEDIRWHSYCCAVDSDEYHHPN